MSKQPPSQPEPRSAAHSPPRAEPTCDDPSESATARLVSILDGYLLDLKAGRAPSRQELMDAHPALAAQLEACLAGLEFIHDAESATPGRPRQLGDFRIIREVGRGGMGAVFEAEQISLRRSVALKILRYGAVSDPESIERFQREAETVAKLHHTNIVPIFNVGSEHGVNYYAMQFIAGRSLAEVAANLQEPLPAGQVAEWGLQAAEALAHAHQRGVIHRDVKPSNLLLDQEQRLWLTDFGLARGMDDVTLSITGAMLGTPRYMSPEQAAAAHKQVDHRSDLFSLGATLYELLSGQPAFPGHTPHDVVRRILSSEPVPLRQLAQDVPRDLETIVMKCLAKEPAARYQTASELAADLRACLDGRPIRARRAGWVERSARWVKRQQQSVKLAATAVALTLLVTIGSGLGWYAFDVWRQAAMTLNAARPPLVVEILDAGDQLVRVETAPTQNPVQVPAGDYRLRVNADGQLSETYDVGLARGSEVDFTLDPQDQLLWTPRNLERGFDVVDFGDAEGLVLWNESGIGLQRRLPPLGWTRELAAELLPRPDQVPGFRWPWSPAWQEHSGYGPYDVTPCIVPRALDVDGRGLGDLIVAARHQAWLMAVSGDDGKILWFAARGRDVAEPTTPRFNDPGGGVQSAVLSVPILGPDFDSDGTADIIATLADSGAQPTSGEGAPECWVEALSGKTGETLWRYEIPRAWFELPDGQEVPYALRWFTGGSRGATAAGGLNLTLGRHQIRDYTHQYERAGTYGYRPAAVALVTVAGAVRLAVVAGTRLIVLDPATGKSDDPSIDLGTRPGRVCQWADVNGDGSSDLVMIERQNTGNSSVRFTRQDPARLVAWSLAKRKPLWTKDLDAQWPRQPTWTVEAPRWPLLVDLDGDNACEIVVPDGSSASNRVGGVGFSDVPWGAVTVLAGATGERLWMRRLVSMDQQIDHFAAGPDLDQDGCREVYAVTLAGSATRAYVDALSGRNGDTLWTNSLTVPPDRNSSLQYHLAPPHWWSAGADGWPQLIGQVVEGEGGTRRGLIGLFSAGTGRLAHLGHNITSVRLAEIDGDGTQDLLVFAAKTRTEADLGGVLHCVRGVANEQWARIGDAGEPFADFDGDGTRDLLAGFPSEWLAATSGATGAKLWRARITTNGRKFQVRPAAAQRGQVADLDGDGTEDLLGWAHLPQTQRRGAPLFALSGRTGRKLWTASDISVQMLNTVIGAEAHDLDGDGKPEVLWLAALDYGYPLRPGPSAHEFQLWLFVTSGQTGKLRWSAPLSSAYGQAPGSVMPISLSQTVVSPTVGDVNGDGASDLLVPQLLPDGQSLQTVALSGKDGAVLWSRPAPGDPGKPVSLSNWAPPAVCDLDGDGETEVVLVEVAPGDAGDTAVHATYRVVSLRGRDGGEIWKWISACACANWQPLSGPCKGELMRPHRLRGVAQEPRVAVLLPGHDGAVVVFDSTGAAHQRKANDRTSASGIWVCDVDRDDVDELAFFAEDFLCVTPADELDQPLWTQPLSNLGEHRILGIVSASADSSPVLAVARDASDNSVFGIEAATGQRVWSCPGVIARGDGVYFAPRQIALLNQQSALPHVYYSYSDVSRCRQAIPSLARESNRAAHSSTAITSTGISSETNRGQPGETNSALLDRHTVRGDDRWALDLPWIAQPESVPGLVPLMVWSLVFALLLVVLPIAYVARLVIVRRFSLRTLLTLPVVAGLFLAAWLIKTSIDREFAGLVPRLWAGLTFSPLIVAGGLAAVWFIKGRWRRICFWFGAALTISVCCAAISLTLAASRSPQAPEVHYDLTGWYLVGLFGAYVASWLLMIAWPTERLAIWVFNRCRGGSRAARPDATPHPDSTLSVEITSSP